MVSVGDKICPKCGGELKHYDKVKRIVRTKNRATSFIEIRRLRCVKCHSVHREIPDNIVPYKQYESDVIEGVLENFITSDTLGFEDYPCNMTMIRWQLNKKLNRRA